MLPDKRPERGIGRASACPARATGHSAPAADHSALPARSSPLRAGHSAAAREGIHA